MNIRSILLDHGLQSSSDGSTTSVNFDSLNQQITSLDQYVNGAFSDGIVTQIEAAKIGAYINILNESNQKVLQEYTSIYNNADLTDQTIKSSLLNAKQTYDQDYNQLITDIQNAIADGTATQQEGTLVDTDYVALVSATGVLMTAIESARISILGKRSSDTLSAAQTYTDGVQVSGRNLLQDTAFFTNNTLPYWSLVVGSNITATLNNILNDPVYQGVLSVSLTANSATGNNSMVLQNNSLTLPNGQFVQGQQYTLSILIQNAFQVVVNFRDPDGTNPVTTDYVIPANSTWTHYSYTFTATNAGNTPVFYLAKNDNTSLGNIDLTQIKLEAGSRGTGWSAAPEEVGNTFQDLSKRITNVELNTTSDAITSTVISSVNLGNLLDAKVNSSDLGSYATQDQLNNMVNTINSTTDGKIANINFSTFATISSVNQTATGITEQFSSFGGINILLNSVGYSSTDFWTVTGSAVTTQAAELAPYGSLSGFVLNGGTMSQQVTVQPNMTFIISAYVKKGTAGTGYLQVSDGSQTVVSNLVSGTAYNYQQISVQISPVGTQFTITINGDSASGGTTFTSIMANAGTTPLQWTNNPKELYTTSVQADINGLRVSHQDNGVLTGLTVLTPEKFAGYQDVNNDGVVDQTTGSIDEIFRVDKNTFLMKSATIGPVQIVQVSSGGRNGIAFVSSN